MDIPEDDIRWLDRKAAELGKSRTAVVRDAISAYRIEIGKDWIRKGAGYWKGRTDIGDALEYQRAMREDRDSG